MSVSVGCFLSMSSLDPKPHFIREVEARPVKGAIVYVFQCTLKVFNQIIIRACSIKTQMRFAKLWPNVMSSLTVLLSKTRSVVRTVDLQVASAVVTENHNFLIS